MEEREGKEKENGCRTRAEHEMERKEKKCL